MILKLNTVVINFALKRPLKSSTMHSPEAVCHYAVAIFYIASDTFHGMNSCVTLDHTYRLMLFLDDIAH